MVYSCTHTATVGVKGLTSSLWLTEFLLSVHQRVETETAELSGQT